MTDDDVRKKTKTEQEPVIERDAMAPGLFETVSNFLGDALVEARELFDKHDAKLWGWTDPYFEAEAKLIATVKRFFTGTPGEETVSEHRDEQHEHAAAEPKYDVVLRGEDALLQQMQGFADTAADEPRQAPKDSGRGRDAGRDR